MYNTCTECTECAHVLKSLIDVTESRPRGWTNQSTLALYFTRHLSAQIPPPHGLLKSQYIFFFRVDILQNYTFNYYFLI